VTLFTVLRLFGRREKCMHNNCTQPSKSRSVEETPTDVAMTVYTGSEILYNTRVLGS